MRKKEEAWPKIKKTAHKSGQMAWLVDARICGKGERLYFKTKTEADTKAELFRIARRNEGISGVSIPERLRIEAMEAEKKLAEVGATIPEAVAFFLKHARPPQGHKLASDVVAEFLRQKEQAGRKASYLDVQKYVLSNVFGKQFGKDPIHEISHVSIEEWMGSQSWTIRTRLNYFQDIRNLFGFALKRGYCVSNPLNRLEKPIVTRKAPGILTLEQAVALLVATEATCEKMLPSIAIGLFCGLRSNEIQSLDWQHVNLDARTIEVTAEKAKTRDRRIVDIPENLLEWLTPYKKSSGCIAPPKSFDWHLKACAAAAKIQTWPRNALRHTFASFHLAHFKNAGLTANQLGHCNNTQTLFNSYRELVSPAAAAKYWKIAPDAKASAKVISILAA